MSFAQQQVKYYLGHGITGPDDHNGKVQMETIAGWLQNIRSMPPLVNPSYDMRTNILSQSSVLKTQIDTSIPSILIGYSMGGLRARSYLQLQSGYKSNIKGLITIDTPHSGAPVINNIPVLTSRLARDLGLALGLITPALSLLGFSVAKPLGYQIGEWATYMQAGETKNDLRPGSVIISQLNAATKTCTLTKVKVNDPLLGIIYKLVTICKYANPSPIPTDVKTMSIRGLNNSIRAMSPIARQISDIGSWAAAGVAAGCAAAVFFTFGLTAPCAIGAADISWVLFHLDDVWANTVVGSTEGDAIVPKTSQNMYQYLGPEVLGGTPILNRYRDISDGQHDNAGGKGVLKHPQTRILIQQYQKFFNFAPLP
jgi:hypothetical protein